MKSGYYWCYTLDSEGNRIESYENPTIVFYSEKNNEVLLIGYDLPMTYSSNKYELVELIEFKLIRAKTPKGEVKVTFDCSKCGGSGGFVFEDEQGGIDWLPCKDCNDGKITKINSL